jgi:hypothetical protein
VILAIGADPYVRCLTGYANNVVEGIEEKVIA